MTRSSRLAISLLALLLGVSCAHRSAHHSCRHACGADLSETAETRRLVTELFEALNAADVEALDRLYADDFTLWTAGGMPISGTHNKQQALSGMKMIDDAFPGGIVFGITATTVEGNRAAIEAVSNGVHANGLPYHNRYHFLMITRDGQILAFREYMDTLHAYQVLIEGSSQPR